MIELLDDNKFRFYRAKVVYVKDPKLMGRVKVWIPDIQIDVKPTPKNGLWARPANNPYGAGHKDLKDGRKHAGSSHIPSLHQWVWVFFENDNPNIPYYVSALYIENQPILPENMVNQEYWNKWIMHRSPRGRVIMISDDPEDARTMITGKKNEYDPDNPIQSVYKVKDNQNMIVIDEAGPQDNPDNKDKIMALDHHGNFIRMHVWENKLYIYESNEKGRPGEIYIYTNRNMIKISEKGTGYIQLTNDGGTINIDGNGTINIDAKKTIYLNAGESIIMNAGVIHENCYDGVKKQPDPIPKIKVNQKKYQKPAPKPKNVEDES